MWTVDQWAGLLAALAVVLTAIAGLVAAVSQLVKSWRRPDDKPAPEVGIPAAPAHDDIDYRAYVDLKDRLTVVESDLREMTKQRDAWMRRALGINEDTEPTTPTT